MAPTPHIVQLPNGHTLTVVPVFGGYFFKSHDLNIHNSVFPAGWTVILQSEDYSDDHHALFGTDPKYLEPDGATKEKRHHHIHPFRKPTLRNDNIFISSISNPSSSDFKAPPSPTRMIAMMLWASLYWYFHQPEPSPYLASEASRSTPEAGKPKGEWAINVKREGVFRGRNLIQKLERMGMISTEDSSVGVNPEENAAEGWSDMFISRRSFWQLSPTLFLFSLAPTTVSAFPGSPYGSRPNSPVPSTDRSHSPNHASSKREATEVGPGSGLWSPSSAGPFASGSHLSTYYPPPPLQYTMTSGIRHPIRPKPPRQGEIFYNRYIPSIGQFLSFRTASLSPKAVAYTGSTSLHPSNYHLTATTLSSVPSRVSGASTPDPTPRTTTPETEDTTLMSDVQLLHKWMNIPRVSKYWDCPGPASVQEEFLRRNLTSNHSFPAIGLWDGKPFGYFEIYWVKEDILGKHLGAEAENFDRGMHVLVGEEEFRGKHRVHCWLTSMAHWAFLHDYRTNAMVLEPRVDNERFIMLLNESGFLKETEITFPHKQSAFVKLRRDNFEAPAL